MKQEQVLEGNKLIAEFMGLVPNRWDGGKTYAIGEVQIIEGNEYAEDWAIPKYDSSCDWLMPVVNKICQTHVNDFSLTIKPFFYSVQISNRYKKFNGQSLNSEIEAIYQAVIRFIKWHNRHMKWYKNLMQKHKQC